MQSFLTKESASVNMSVPTGGSDQGVAVAVKKTSADQVVCGAWGILDLSLRQYNRKTPPKKGDAAHERPESDGHIVASGTAAGRIG
jgi:hypothetical protein